MARKQPPSNVVDMPRKRGKPGPKTRGMAPAPDVPATATVVIDEVAAPYVARLRSRWPGSQLTEEERRAAMELLAIYDGNTGRVSHMSGLSKRMLFDLKHQDVGEFSSRRTAWKQALALESADVTIDALARVRETVGEAGPRDSAIIYGILVDKSMALAGDAPGTTVTHHVRVSADPALVAAMRGTTRQLLTGPVVEADYVNLPPANETITQDSGNLEPEDYGNNP